MKRTLKLLALILAFIFMLSSTVFASNQDAEEQDRSNQIVELLAQRQIALHRNAADPDELNAIDSELTDLDVEFLSTDEVAIQFPEAVATLENNGTAVCSNIGDATVSPNWYEKPNTAEEVWFTWYSELTYNGTRYKVQHLAAQPSLESSALWSEGDVAVNVPYEIPATDILLELVGYSQSIEKIATALSVTEAIAEFLNNLSGITRLPAHDAIYSWESSSTVCFSYVAPADNSEEPIFSHITNMCTTAVSVIIDTDIRNEHGALVANSLSIDDYTLTAVSDYFMDASRACYGYTLQNSGITSNILRDCITRVDINGADGELVVMLLPYIPSSILFLH